MLTDEQKVLGEMIEQLEPNQVRAVLDFVRRLPQFSVNGHDYGVDYSDTWSEEDLEDWKKSGLDHMEAECPYDDDTPGGTSDVQPR